MSDEIAVVDISPMLSGDGPAKARLAREIDRACREIGFLLVTGHGVSAALIDDWFAVSREFFALPEAQKDACRPEADSLHQGYHGMSSAALAQGEGQATPPDLREYFMIGRPDIDADYFQSQTAKRFYRRNVWPARPDGFRAMAEAYYAAVEQLARRLMGLFALALDLPEAYFDDKVDRHFGILSSIFYPAQKELPRPGQLRAGAHSDYGSLTILAPTDAPGGLQVLAKSGAWIDVPYVPGAFVINIGDMMARWTNDRWVSTMHRVVNPPATTAAPRPRQSVAFFLHPNYDTVVECLATCAGPEQAARYAPIPAGEYMLAKEGRINARPDAVRA
jgi:isopenicillin N synthase-like dioxygenase